MSSRTSYATAVTLLLAMIVLSLGTISAFSPMKVPTSRSSPSTMMTRITNKQLLVGPLRATEESSSSSSSSSPMGDDVQEPATENDDGDDDDVEDADDAAADSSTTVDEIYVNGSSEPIEFAVDENVASEEDDDTDESSPSDVEEQPVDNEISAESITADGSESSMDANEALMKLLKIAATTGRGEFATNAQKDEAAELISVLEGQNPNPDEPAKNLALMNGRWELLYSSTQLFRSSPFFMAGRAVCSTEEQAQQYDWFCDMHRKALAISTIGQVRQVITSTRMVSEFEVNVGSVPFLNDFTPFSYSGGWPVTIEGAIVSSADITPTTNGDGWELYMDTVEIKGSNMPGLRQLLDGGLKLSSRQLGDFLESNVDSYTNPRPVFTTTYLSESIRISRDQDGKVFVYGKLSDGTEPTDYSKIDADLGILKLLGGFNDSILKFYF